MSEITPTFVKKLQVRFLEKVSYMVDCKYYWTEKNSVHVGSWSSLAMVFTQFPIIPLKCIQSIADNVVTHQVTTTQWGQRPAAMRHTLKPFEAAIWAAVQPSLSAWLISSAGTTGLDVPSGLSSPWSKSKTTDSDSSSCKEFLQAGALWYIRSLRLSTLPVSTAAWTGVQPSWR